MDLIAQTRATFTASPMPSAEVIAGAFWREFIIRVRLSTLVVLVTAFAALLAVIKLDERAWTEATAVDATIAGALTEIGVSTEEHFGIGQGPAGAASMPAYPFAGSRVSYVRGGVLLGPSFIERQIEVADMVDVTIKVSCGWMSFAGKPHVTVHGKASPANSWFVGSLQEKLREDGVVAASGK